MSEALDRVIEALAGASEDEVAAALTAVGVLSSGQPPLQPVPNTPLPRYGGSPHIHSKVEWV